MTILPELLIAAPMLQDILFDVSTGLPLVDGTITMYEDTSRTTLKNWYYQTGSPGAYTYLPLPNPMTLDGIGTITDGSGNDVIPFYYPYVENSSNPAPQAYYVVVQNALGQVMFTRANFPYNPGGGGTPEPPGGDENLNNLVMNNIFWRHLTDAGSNTVLTLTNITNTIIAPGMHDGFANVPGGLGGSDIQFFKSTTGSVDVMNFTEFLQNQYLGSNNQDVAPEFYLNFTSNGGMTETYKYIQIPLCLHVKCLDAVDCTYTIWTRCNSGNNLITLSTFQFLGTGVSSTLPTPNITISAASGWTKTVVNFTTPPAPASSSLGAAGDDALYLLIGYPLGQAFNIDIAKPEMYIGNLSSTNSFVNYDEVNAIISSPRTGDVKQTLNSFGGSLTNSLGAYGYVPLNDGTIGNALSTATTRANVDTWPLYLMLWDYFSALTSNGSPYYLIYTDASAPTTYGASAYADFIANKQLSLPQSFGEVITGTAPNQNSQAVTLIAANVLTTGSTVSLYDGAPVIFTATAFPTGIAANIVYYAINISTTTFEIASTYDNALSGTNIAVGTVFTGLNVISNLIGSSTGQYMHTQLANEVGVHTHSSTGTYFRVGVSAGGTLDATAGALNAQVVTTANNVGGTAFNIVQPTTYYNVFLKL